MDLPTVWFVAVALLWTGYLVLEGFDFGVGMLVRVLGRTEDDRRVALGAIGPVWDGNEVWLITAVGAMFAAFPVWYASMFSGLYLPVLAVLLALIVRGVGLEYREKVDDPAWRARWDAGIAVGSLVPAFVWGLVLANVVRGLPFSSTGVTDAGFTDVVDGYGLLGGLTVAALSVLHGAVFLALKTDGPVRRRARTLAARAGLPVTVLLGAFLWWTVAQRPAPWTAAVAVVAVLVMGLGAVAAARGREGWAFAATAASIAGLGAVLFGSLFPAVLPSTTDPALTLTVANASSAPYTLGIMTWVAAVFLPVVLAYQAWSYWVFRRRLGGEPVAPEQVARAS